MHATVGLVRPEQLGAQLRIGFVQATEVVGVDDADIALTGIHREDHRVVVGKHVGGQVVDPATQDLLGLVRTVGLDQRPGQGLVVHLLAGAQAQATFPLGAGQGFVGAQLCGLHALGGVDDGPRAQRQAGPGVRAGAVLRRDVGVDHRRSERLQDTHLLGLPEVAGIHRDQQVGRAILTLGLDALHQRRFLIGDELDLHPGLGGIGVEHRLDQFVDARGVDHHLIGSEGGTGGAQGKGSKQAFGQRHGVMLS